MDHLTFVDADTLASRLEDPDWVLLDCRFELAKPAWGEEAFASGHIPGAQYAHLDRDLSSPVTPATGRHPLPDAAAFARRARRGVCGALSRQALRSQGSLQQAGAFPGWLARPLWRHDRMGTRQSRWQDEVVGLGRP